MASLAKEEFCHVGEQHLSGLTDDAEFKAVRPRRVKQLRPMKEIDVKNRFRLLDESPCADTGNAILPTEEDQSSEDQREAQQSLVQVRSDQHQDAETEENQNTQDGPGTEQASEAVRNDDCQGAGDMLNPTQQEETPCKLSRKKKRSRANAQDCPKGEPQEYKGSQATCKSSTLSDISSQDCELQYRKLSVGVAGAINASAVAALMIAANALHTVVDKDETPAAKHQGQQKQNHIGSARRSAQWQSKSHQGHCSRPQIRRSAGRGR